MFGWLQDPQLTTEQCQASVCDPDAQEVIPEGTTSLVDWIKAPVRSVYPEKGDCPTPPINAKWNTPDAADMLHMQAMWEFTKIFTH